MKTGDLVKCSGIGVGVVIKIDYANAKGFQHASPVATVHWFRKGAFAELEKCSVESQAYLEIISKA